MTERIVRKVEATRQMHTMAPLRAMTRRKAACYLRISTRSDEQENSFISKEPFKSLDITSRAWFIASVVDKTGTVIINQLLYKDMLNIPCEHYAAH